jgi:hypothetical protein
VRLVASMTCVILAFLLCTHCQAPSDSVTVSAAPTIEYVVVVVESQVKSDDIQLALPLLLCDVLLCNVVIVFYHHLIMPDSMTCVLTCCLCVCLSVFVSISLCSNPCTENVPVQQIKHYPAGFGIIFTIFVYVVMCCLNCPSFSLPPHPLTLESLLLFP